MFLKFLPAIFLIIIIISFIGLTKYFIKNMPDITIKKTINKLKIIIIKVIVLIIFSIVFIETEKKMLDISLLMKGRLKFETKIVSSLFFIFVNF